MFVGKKINLPQAIIRNSADLLANHYTGRHDASQAQDTNTVDKGDPTAGREHVGITAGGFGRHPLAPASAYHNEATTAQV